MLARRLHGTLDRFHDDDRGAVAMAAMAACMLLFMLSLVLWDAGHVVRKKVDLQNAADTAAYSKAAVNARSMNMIAFTNISKRTVVGIHNTYWGMFLAYAGWTATQCAICCGPPCTPPPTPTFCWCRAHLCSCRNCVGNGLMLLQEAVGDWSDFAGFALLPFPTPNGSYSSDVFGEELKALNNYQNYIKQITPWWGWAEQLVRGIRNGATVTASWPPPPDRLTGIVNEVQNVLNYPFVPNSWSLPVTMNTDGLPVTNGVSGTTGTYLNKFLPDSMHSIGSFIGSNIFDKITLLSNPPSILNLNPPGDSNNSFTLGDAVYNIEKAFFNTEACSPGIPGMSPMTNGSLAEVAGNVIQHQRRSASSPNFACDGPSSATVVASGAAVATALCPVSAILPQFRHTMTPYRLNGSRSLGQGSDSLPNSFGDMSGRSNIIFAYKRSPEFQEKLRDNYDILGDDYYERGQGWQKYQDMPVLKASGQWALSRSEIVHTNRAEIGTSNHINVGSVTQGVHNTWMWHPGWTAKLRPLAFEGEFSKLSPGSTNFLNAAFHDVTHYLIGGASLMGVAQGNLDFWQMAWDMLYMEKSTRAVDDSTSDGIPK